VGGPIKKEGGDRAARKQGGSGTRRTPCQRCLENAAAGLAGPARRPTVASASRTGRGKIELSKRKAGATNAAQKNHYGQGPGNAKKPRGRG